MPVEKIIQELMDGIPVPIRIVHLNDDGIPVYTHFNKFSLAGAGVTLDDIIGKSAAEIFPGTKGKEATARHNEVFATGKPLTYVHQLDLTAGMRTLQTTLAPLSLNDEDDSFVIVATTIDKTAALLNEESSLKAEKMHQEILRFTELAAHDLRAPMRQVKMLADIMKDDFQDLGDGKLELIDTIHLVSDRTMLLVTDLLQNSSRISKIRNFEEFKLTSLGADLMMMLDPLRHNSLTTSDTLLSTDKTTLQIVLRNLMDNAFKHNYPNSIHVDLDVKTNNRSHFLTFIFSDTGAGFSGLNNVFEVKDSSRVKQGLGLPAIKQMIVSRGGSIHIEKRGTQKGAVIGFSLPGELIFSDFNAPEKVA